MMTTSEIKIADIPENAATGGLFIGEGMPPSIEGMGGMKQSKSRPTKIENSTIKPSFYTSGQTKFW